MENRKICFESDGTKETGKRIINELLKLGGRNSGLEGIKPKGYYYFINPQGLINNTMCPSRYNLKIKQLPIVEKQNVIINNMKNRTLTPKQAQSIINIACEEWKKKLAVLWAKDIVLTKNIEVSEEFYTEMRKVCTAPQNELFDEIFGNDDELIKAINLKEGECILCKEKHGVDALILKTALGFVDLNELGWGVKDINSLCKGIKVKLNITYEQI